MIICFIFYFEFRNRYVDNIENGKLELSYFFLLLFLKEDRGKEKELKGIVYKVNLIILIFI